MGRQERQDRHNGLEKTTKPSELGIKPEDMTATEGVGICFILVYKPKNCAAQYWKGKDQFRGQMAGMAGGGLHGRESLPF